MTGFSVFKEDDRGQVAYDPFFPIAGLIALVVYAKILVEVLYADPRTPTSSRRISDQCLGMLGCDGISGIISPSEQLLLVAVVVIESGVIIQWARSRLSA